MINRSNTNNPPILSLGTRTNTKLRALLFIVSVVLLLPTTPAITPADSIFGGLQEAREYRTAVGLLKQGDYELARSQYQSFIETYPDSNRLPRAYFGLAETYYLEGKYPNAAKHYLESLKAGNLSDQYHEQALRRGLDAVNRSGRLNLGEEYLDELEGSMDSADDEIMRRIVQVLSKNGQSSLALKWARRQFKNNPGSKYWRYETAVLHADSKNYDQATELLQPLLVGGSDYQNDAKYLLAEINYEKGNIEPARQYYNDLATDSDYRHDASYGLAWIEIKKRNIARAKQRLKSLSESSPALRSRAARDLARIYRSEKNDTPTQEWYRKAIDWAEEPRQSELRIEFGDYFVNTDRLTRAIPYYENARSLGLQGQKRLIRGYMMKENYQKAAEAIREFQSQRKLEGPVWQRRLSLAYYQLGNYTRSLDTLPSVNRAPDGSERRRILSLKGSLHYRLGQWKSARSVYDSMSREFSGIEPKYYLALLSEKLRDDHDALSRLRQLREETTDATWLSRINYQLARLNYESEKYSRYKTTIENVEPSQLSPMLRVEVKILRMANTVRQDPGDRSKLEKSLSVRNEAAQFGQIGRWYGYLVHQDLPEFWWDELLLPSLRNDSVLRESWGARTIAILRENDQLDRSYQLAEDLLTELTDSRVKRNVRAELFNTLRARNDNRIIGRYLPDRSSWSEWQGSNRRALALALANYHRGMDQPKSGREALLQLLKTTSKSDNNLIRDFNEWIASFEIDLGKYKQARNRLTSLPEEHRDFSGNLNLSIAEYHLGDTTVSFNRIKDLHDRGRTDSITLYEYAFRHLRDRHRNDGLHDWSQQLLSHHNPTDTEVRSLLLENIRYWVNNGYNKRGLDYIDSVLAGMASAKAKVPFRYYRAMAHFNQDELDRAYSILQSITRTVNTDTTWYKRVQRSQVEIKLRRKDWKGAYNHWKRLHESGSAAGTARRLLSVSGLKSSPESFREFLSVLQEHYAGELSDGEITFWQARLNEVTRQPERAIEGYRTYLDDNNQNHRRRAIVRLARLYDRVGQHEKSLEKYQTLHRRTDDPLYRLQVGVQLRKLGRLAESRTVLEEIRTNVPSLELSARYQLGYTLLEQENYRAALKNFRRSLKNTSEPTGWLQDARRRTVELALRLEKTDLASRTIDSMQDGPERTLFRAELFRQLNELDRAHELVLTISPEAKDDDEFKQRYQNITAALHWQRDDYPALIDTFDTLPEQRDHREWYVKSLVQANQFERAEKLLSALESELRRTLRMELADRYYEQNDWDAALRHYRQLKSTPRVDFRIGNIHRKLNDPRQAYQTWAKSLRNPPVDPDDEWLATTVEGIVGLTDPLDKSDSTARILDNHWELPLSNKASLAERALKWSIASNNRDLASRYMDRIDAPTPNAFEAVASSLKEQSHWKLLEKWVTQYDKTGRSDALPLKYYRDLTALRNSDATIDPAVINNHINEALRKKSPYAEKLQILLGDYHFSRENYKQAAIEYRKVDLLFENETRDPLVQLKLAKSYNHLKQSEKARAIYESLTEDDIPEAVRKEAEKWLEQRSDES